MSAATAERFTSLRIRNNLPSFAYPIAKVEPNRHAEGDRDDLARHYTPLVIFGTAPGDLWNLSGPTGAYFVFGYSEKIQNATGIRSVNHQLNDNVGSFLAATYQNSLEAKTPIEILPFMREINSRIVQRDFSFLGDLIGRINLTLLSRALLLTLVRMTATVKSEINGWDNMLTRVQSEISRRGDNPKELLRDLG